MSNLLQQVGSSSVEVVTNEQTSIDLQITSTGVRGDAGLNEVGGFPFDVTDAQENDLLQLKSEAWTNTPQENITDGGNF